MTGEPAGQIVHLGLGAFHRAHQAAHTAHAGDAWGIVGVAPRSSDIVDAMRRQDLRYSLLTLSESDPEVEELRVHTDVMNAAHEPDRVAAAIAHDLTSIVTLTVTERGYTLGADGHLDLDDPGVRADTASAGSTTPRTVLGHLARALRARAEGGGHPLAVVSCDNLARNGRTLRRALREHVSAVDAGWASDLLDYVDTAVTFPSTMVDRIVPATTGHHRDEVERLTGRRDAVPVAAEPFSMWVLEDRFPAGRPAWHTSGAIMSDEVGRYEAAKLAMLNGSHSLLAAAGTLAGLPGIADAVRDPVLRSVTEHYLTQEAAVAITMPSDLDSSRYADQLIGRFENAALGHTCRQVCSDGSTKLPNRLGDVVVSGVPTPVAALTVAAWLAVVLDPRHDDVVEPRRERIRDAARPGHTAEALLTAADIGPALLAPSLVSRVEASLHVITRHGIYAAAREAVPT